MKKIIKPLIYIIMIIVIGIIIYAKWNKNDVKFEASSALVDIKEIQDLYLANFTWNGIAEIYKDGKVKTYIKYESVVEAKLDLKNFNQTMEVNEDKKEIYVYLPDIELTPVIRTKSDSFSFIPEGANINMKEVLKVCEEDAVREATDNPELMNVAKINAKSTIEGLLLPLVKENGYKVVWKDGE